MVFPKNFDDSDEVYALAEEFAKQESTPFLKRLLRSFGSNYLGFTIEHPPTTPSPGPNGTRN